MIKNMTTQKKRCPGATNSGMIWLHSKHDSKIVKKGSDEYNNLLDNGYYIDRAIALGIKKEETDALEDMELSELKEIAKGYGIKGYGNSSKETLIKKIEDKEHETE